MKRASFITLTIIGAYSALQATGRLIIHYRPKAAVLLVRIKPIPYRKVIKPAGYRPAF